MARSFGDKFVHNILLLSAAVIVFKLADGDPAYTVFGVCCVIAALLQWVYE